MSLYLLFSVMFIKSENKYLDNEHWYSSSHWPGKSWKGGMSGKSLVSFLDGQGQWHCHRYCARNALLCFQACVWSLFSGCRMQMNKNGGKKTSGYMYICNLSVTNNWRCQGVGAEKRSQLKLQKKCTWHLWQSENISWYAWGESLGISFLKVSRTGKVPDILGDVWNYYMKYQRMCLVRDCSLNSIGYILCGVWLLLVVDVWRQRNFCISRWWQSVPVDWYNHWPIWHSMAILLVF